MIYRIIIFLIINFAALAIGGIYTGKGVPSDWYIQLDKAPWTPPGWVFGTAWTTIMICFALFMAWLWPQVENKTLLVTLFLIQLLLNIGWNPAFFYFHQITLGFIIISGLTLLVGFIFFNYLPVLKIKSLLILPYLLWLLIATSLNLYILIKN